MKWLVAGCRVLALICLLILGSIVGCFISLLPSLVREKIIMYWYRAAFFVIGAHCCFNHSVLKNNVLIASNHISWLDIVVIGSHFPVVFLAKSDIFSWPILGWLARRVGTLPIDRGRGATEATQALNRSLEKGHTVVIFPEGKTSAGHQPNHYYPRLFQAAIDSQVTVYSLVLKYQTEKGAIAHSVNYSDDISFLRSLCNTILSPTIRVSVQLSNLGTGLCRDTFAKKAENHAKTYLNLEVK